MRLDYMTAGESHGPQLTAIVRGVPAGLPITAEQINADLARRQQGYGRGARMKIEKDTALIRSGVRKVHAGVARDAGGREPRLPGVGGPDGAGAGAA